MRNLNSVLRERFAREDLSVCRCLVLKLVNGDTHYITDLTRDVPFAGQVFKPSPAIDVSAVRLSRELGAQNAEITFVYDDEDGYFTERRVRFGLLNDALCELWYVDYRAPEYGGALVLSGKVAQVEQPSKAYAVLQLSSAVTAQQSLLYSEVYAKRCRNVFGDKRCKVDVDALSVPFTVVRNFPDLASFAINGYTAPQAPPEGAHIPLENGKYLQVELGEFDFTVPDAQILKLRLRSGGGGGATSGGMHYSLNYNVTMSPGFAGNNAFDAYVKRTTRGEVELMRLAGGSGGTKFPGSPRPNQPFAIFDKPPKGSPGYYKGGLLVPVDPVVKGGLGGKGSASGGGGSYEGGAMGSLEGQGGDGGDGFQVDYVFYLEDPACPIKAGDRLHFSLGAPGDSPDDGPTPEDPFSEAARYDTYPGKTGQPGSFELVWQSNVGEQPEPKTFNLGSVKWLTGDNAGQLIGIASNEGGLITLTTQTRMPINPGDTGLLRPGCSNYADMCEDRWNNLINMQAEPATPQGITTLPTPIADTTQDLSKPPANSGAMVGFPYAG